MKKHNELDKERGAGAVQTLGYFFVLAVLFFSLVSAAAMMQAKHRAQAAADLGAIAGAQAVAHGEAQEAACAYAGRIAQGNQSNLISCDVTGEQVALRVQSQPALSALPVVSAHAVAAPDNYQGR